MNKVFIKLLSCCFICMILLLSCDKYPINSLLNPHDPIGNWPNPWYLYDDQWNTKGTLEPYIFKDYPDGSPNPYCDTWEHVKLNFSCTDFPQSGISCIMFYWKGNSQDVSVPRKTFISFGMQSRIKLGETIDISVSGYRYLKFYLRGDLYENCVFELSIPNKDVPDTPWVKYQARNTDITPYWKEITIELPEEKVSQMTNLEYCIAMALKIGDFSGITNGGTVYLDNIRLTKD